MRPQGDFDGDGKVDILWRNATTGANTIWLMNGVNVAAQAALPTIPDQNWTIGAVGDLSGDGQSDIVWRNQATGQDTIWVMNGTALSSQIPLPPVFDLAWRIRGIGDFNGDGKPDIVWRNATTGANTVWFMNGPAVISAAPLPTVSDVKWEIVGIADFSGDGKPDLLWRHGTTGQNTIWVMNGTGVASLASMPAQTDVNWQIAGVGDFSGDGKIDILWRHAFTGGDAVWQMNGTVVAGSLQVPTVTDLGWRVAGMPVITGPPLGDVVRFLEQATFGPNEASINTVTAVGFSSYIDQQLAMPSSGWPVLPLQPSSVPATCASTCQRDNYTMYPLQLRFFTNALYGQDQLRQRVIWTLHQLLVVSGRDISLPGWMLPYIQILDRNAFGNYRQILFELSLNPAMGQYLNMATSTKNNPNENYAREVLQLFSIGTQLLNHDGSSQLDLNGDPKASYDQSNVTTFARVFTGWRLGANVGPGVPDYVSNMVLIANNHDVGAKTLLNGVTLLAGSPGGQDMNSAIDDVFYHSNLSPFIARHFIHQMVTSNPSPAYVSRVASAFDDDGTGVRGNIGALVKAVLLDPEARGTSHPDPNYGHLREPAQFALNLLRAFNAKSANLASNSDGYVNPQVSTMSQDVFRPQTVFSYYPADYLLPGSTTVAAPQFGLMDSSSALRRVNFINTMVFSTIGVGANSPTGTALDLTPIQNLAGDPVQLVAYLNQLLMHGSMSAAMQNSIINSVLTIPGTSPRLRAQHALYLVATSSQYQVQQ
ncbi:MAG: DUF1800 family protein [Acidobacteriota bacterium]